MEFLKILFAKSKSLYFFLAILSLINGVLNTTLLMFINSTINSQPLPIFPQYDWAVFMALIITSLISTKVFQTHMIRLTTSINFDFEIAILKKLKLASFQDFEKLGNEKVFTAISDIRVLSNLPEVFMTAINAFIIVFCCFIYLIIISSVGALFIFLLMLSLFIFYTVRNKKVEEKLGELRTLLNGYYRYLNDLLLGYKEIKISPIRNETIHENYLKTNLQKSKKLRLATSIQYMNNELTGSYSWYLVLGVIMFVLPRVLSFDISEISAFLITILFLMGPIAILITLIPTYSNVKIALDRLNQFNQAIVKHIQVNDSVAEESQGSFSNFEHIEFKDVYYEYYDEEQNQTFSLGPINLEISAGEIVFITGGNGSGKSTFANLLTGLYTPKTGEIILNGIRVTEQNHHDYINNISAIFTSAFLFSEDYDEFDLKENHETLQEYIDLLKLTGIAKLNEEQNLLDSNLSKGQQKRLSLIYALLEDKDVMVLDEWAAEQDPSFRAYFYETLVPGFVNDGKTIIAITHDDNYYSEAHRVIKFDFGQIVTDSKNTSSFVTAVNGVDS